MITREAFVKEWCKDLRSGKFIQGQGCLKTPDGKYCCLGVARETAIRLGIAEALEDQDYSGVPGPWFRNSVFDTCNPEIEIDNKRATCSYHNDTLDATFQQIAEGLEKEFLSDNVPQSV